MSTAADAVSLLENLGDTPARVAESLGADGVKGVRGSLGGCPVANKLRSRFGCAFEVYGEIGIAVHGVGKYENFELPRPVAWFVRDFDAGDYPNLEEEQHARVGPDAAG